MKEVECKKLEITSMNQNIGNQKMAFDEKKIKRIPEVCSKNSHFGRNVDKYAVGCEVTIRWKPSQKCSDELGALPALEVLQEESDLTCKSKLA